MKVIELHIPTMYKELKEKIQSWIKYIKNPIRRTHNSKVMKQLEREICNELNNGYWGNDISAYMRKELTMGFPNGKINKLMNEAYKNLK